jgi:C-22 sterol desaturase
VARKHISRWLNEAAIDPSAKSIMMTARHMNMETSLRVFCGYHIPDSAIEEINEKYWLITQSLELVNFPLPLPGTKIYKAIRARRMVMNWLQLAAHKSKIAMAGGGQPECMLDEWVYTMAEPGYKGRKDFSDYEMAQVVFSFLFASQDAMSSGLIYGFQHLADHTEVLAAVRKEQERVRGGNYEDAITLDQMDDMAYLQAVVKESMRVKPPVTMASVSPSSLLFVVTLFPFLPGPIQMQKGLPDRRKLHCSGW